jgi:hypothetical protein
VGDEEQTVLTISAAILALAVGRAAVSAQDKYDLKVPGGLALAEFKGYEDWPVVAVQHTDDLVKVVVGKEIIAHRYP